MYHNYAMIKDMYPNTKKESSRTDINYCSCVADISKYKCQVSLTNEKINNLKTPEDCDNKLNIENTSEEGICDKVRYNTEVDDLIASCDLMMKQSEIFSRKMELIFK